VLDADTFLTTLYVMVDDFCKANLPAEVRPGPGASLSRSEVVTLAIFGQWGRFSSERDFFRYAQQRLRAAFPTLPNRTQFNRLLRRHHDAIVAFDLSLREETDLELLDLSAAPVRDRRRRGRSWVAGKADYGYSSREGTFFGFHVLVSVSPQGVICGFAFGPGSAKEQKLAECFFALRHRPHPRLMSVGAHQGGHYVADKGFAGRELHVRWKQHYGASLLSLVPRRDKVQRPKWWHKRLVSLRQIVETVYEKLHHVFRLHRERPHELGGFAARLAAKVGLHNFCIWLNRSLGRPPLQFADLLDW
jgi:hypothetical protein